MVCSEKPDRQLPFTTMGKSMDGADRGQSHQELSSGHAQMCESI